MEAIDPQRPTRRRVLAQAAGAAAAAFAGPAAAGEAASAWSEASHSALRLVGGGRMDERSGERLLAGIAIRLNPGFKTYWRHPGDSGVPPVFRFEGSQNLREAAVRFPSPKRFDDGAGGTSFGYETGEVLLPIEVAPRDPAKPVRLRLQADYAVCERMCVPAHGAAELVLAGGRGAFDAPLRDALEAVPRRAKLGAAGPLAILALRRGAAPGWLAVDLRAPAGVRPELFVEAPPPWFFEAKRLEAAGSGAAAIRAVQTAPAPAGADLVLTLVAGADAIEVEARLDRALIAP